MAVLSGATASGKMLTQIGGVSSTASIAYTSPAYNANVTNPSATAYIKEIMIVNTTGTTATITVYIVPHGTAVANSYEIISGLSINPNDTKVLSGLNTMLPAGYDIQISSGTAGSLNVYISGVEVQ